MVSLLHKIRAIKISLWQFVGLICVLHLLVFQTPLMTFALSVSDVSTFDGFLQIVSLQIVQICLLGIFLFFLSSISISLMQGVTILIVFVNSFALYFMTTYGIDLDRSMIGNIFNSDAREATELWHFSIIPYIVFLGLLPASLIVLVNITAPRRFFRVGLGVCAFATLAVWLFLTAFTSLWFDKHASRLGSKVLPWSYIANTARHFDREAMDGREQVLLPDATFTAPQPTKKEVVILVIGEAVRGDNLSLLGYKRETNPFTKDLDIVAFPIGQSCATNTIASTACILTHEGRDASPRTRFEPLPSYLARQGIKTIYRTNNSGPPPVDVDLYQTAAEIAKTCSGDQCKNRKFDEVLNWQLAQMIGAEKSKRIFITLHQTGSHGPAYYSKYPPEFKHFKPVCETVQISKCTPQDLLNAYDNTIRYTDSLLADLILQLKSLDDVNSTLIYVADHGQSLGESGFYLHGAPLAIAPKEQRRIPFLVWMSEGFRASKGLTNKNVLTNTTSPHDFPFHSVMGAFGMRSEIYKPQFDIFNLENKGN